MFDPRPHSGRPDRGILSALTAEPIVLRADVQADSFQLGPNAATRALNLGTVADLFSGCTVVKNPDGSITVRAVSTGAEA